MKTKIGGRKKGKWSKRREEQNTRFEIKYNINPSDILGPNLKDKK